MASVLIRSASASASLVSRAVSAAVSVLASVNMPSARRLASASSDLAWDFSDAAWVSARLRMSAAADRADSNIRAVSLPSSSIARCSSNGTASAALLLSAPLL